MKLNAIERAAMNNPLRAAHQHHREGAWFTHLAGGSLARRHVLEVGCGRGVGVEVLLDRLHAAEVTAFDLDPDMIDKARRRLRARPGVTLTVGDACEIEQPAGAIDVVAEFGVIHHVPDWQRAIAEIARVLRPGGLLLFEDIPKHTLDNWAMRTFTDHPRTNRFEPDEFVDELGHHGLHPIGPLHVRFAGNLFLGAARKAG